jgi:hypothetical protein
MAHIITYSVMTLYNKLWKSGFHSHKMRKGIQKADCSTRWMRKTKCLCMVPWMMYELRGLLLIKQYKGVKWCWNITTGLIVGEYWRFSAGGYLSKGCQSLGVRMVRKTYTTRKWSPWAPFVGTFQMGQTNWGMQRTRVRQLNTKGGVKMRNWCGMRGLNHEAGIAYFHLSSCIILSHDSN